MDNQFIGLPSGQYDKINTDGGLFGMMGRNLDEAMVKQKEGYRARYDKFIAEGHPPKKASLLADPTLQQFEPDGMMGVAGKVIKKYSIEEAIKSLNPKQKRDQVQMKQYLTNKGVAPKQIERADLPGLNDKAITGTAEEWLSNMQKNPGYGLNVKKPKGREGDNWKDVDVDWKVW